MQKQPDSIELNIFVFPSRKPEGADGSFDNPYGHIAKAPMKAEEQSAQYTSVTIYIYLISSDHFMTRDFTEYDFTFTMRDQYSLSKDIYIQPIFWGQTIDGKFFESSDGDCIEQEESLTAYH